MINIIFSASLCTMMLLFYAYAFKALPDEKWQVFASIPVRKTQTGRWEGVNITYYGILLSTGYVIAMTLFFILLSSAGGTWLIIGAVSAGIMILFVPAAKVMAYIVEGKRNTITVGGASFVMFIAAPWIVKFCNQIFAGTGAIPVDETVFLASLSAAYALGEGFGRLACISFGCCYGKPLNELPLFLREIFSKWNFIFSGSTKKISYHDHLDGSPVVPVQGITAVLYTVTASVSAYLFLEEKYLAAFFLSMAVTQGWRFTSEFLRADYRGETRISAYQVMSLLLLPYFGVYMIFFRTTASHPADILAGIRFLWNPAFFLLLPAIWVISLVYTGISSVTASEISIFVLKDRI